MSETYTGQVRLGLEAFAHELTQASTPPDESWHASIVEAEPGVLRERCVVEGIRVVDSLAQQLADLALTRHRGPDPGERRTAFVRQRLAESAECSFWAWLPWMRTIVRVLPPDEYFAVITNRNQDKLTHGEQLVLRRKRVGVVGLSVGGEAAVTVAQEHLCGHIVLADFDGLDLSNLNRLGAGIDELGVNKAVIVARRIARINPYLGITLYRSGVNEQTMDAFLDGLDLLLEECDSLPLKLEIRKAAASRGLNVIFAGDERGFLSIEPYATHPALAPFHGLVVEPPRSREEYATPVDFMRALTDWLGGWERISSRSRDSLLRVGRDLCGYPQLASEARFAAGQLGHIARRLLLGNELPPSWQHVDLDLILDSTAD